MTNFFWKYRTPSKGWWANYRWHITEPGEKLGLKSNGWEKSFFRSGFQSKVLEVESLANAKKCLKGLKSETITAFGGRFRGASYDKNAKCIIKQAKRSLKKAIKKHNKGKLVEVDKIAIVPNSYYRWKAIIGIGGIVIIIILGLVGVVWFRTKKQYSY